MSAGELARRGQERRARALNRRLVQRLTAVHASLERVAELALADPAIAATLKANAASDAGGGAESVSTAA